MKSKLWIALALAAWGGTSIQAQSFLNKLKQKAEKGLEQSVDKKLGINQPQQNKQGQTNTGSVPGGNNQGGSQGGNQGGAGLISTPPDVKQNLSDAESAFGKSSYGDARYSVQQAMLGVELEIGNQILKSLPTSISGLTYDQKQDQVTSTGWGWAGLTIQRKYPSDNKNFDVTVANNAAWMSAVNVYLSSGGYAQQSGGQQNWKQTKIKGYRAIIEFDQSSGYKLSVPIGQSSLVVFEGRNFATEPDMMSACNAVDLDGIKKMLGEK
ncbi:MAG: hypothetical protein JST43_11780 [Bacteroidetes bacterium]|nr:hypothetical protein [Bacteroidota bacterium]MBS1541322.1 hypothetical protein [Bacteroidota bacterium]